jgi:hypothetical protein
MGIFAAKINYAWQSVLTMASPNPRSALLTHSPDPWNELRCGGAGCAVERLGKVGRWVLKIFDQMEECISI